MSSETKLYLQYGVNVFADEIYKNYQPLASTAYYPDPLATDLRKAIAQYTGFSEEMILCSSGSDELIDIYIRLHKAKINHLKVAYSPPTYPQYDAYTAREKVERIILPHERLSITADMLKKLGGDPKNTVVMLDSPSNPSGELMSREQFIGFLDAGYDVFVDEAYIEFRGQSVADLITLYPDQLVVSRSLSKFAAMSGSRVGYMLASPKIVQEFRDGQLFFNVNSEGQHRGRYAVEHASEFSDAIVNMRHVKRQVEEAIQNLGAYHIHPSLDMFLIFNHKTIPTEKLHASLQESHNIVTTRFPTFKDKDVIRSAVLQLPTMKRLVTALASYA